MSPTDDDREALEAFTRVRRHSDRLVLEVVDSAWKSQEDMDLRWRPVSSFDLSADRQAEDVRRALLNDPAFFFRCLECHHFSHVGQEWRRAICHGCASSNHGVVF